MDRIFEGIYIKSKLLENRYRLREAKSFTSGKDVIDAINDGTLIKFLNGKKYLPAWLKVMADSPDKVNELEAYFNKVVSNTSGQNRATNETICLLVKKSPTFETFKNIINNSLDTLIYYSKSLKSSWIKSLPTFEKVTYQEYDYELWHSFEKDMENQLSKKRAQHNKGLSDDLKKSLYDTVYEDGTWGVYIPKSFEGDSELASHMKPFKDGGEEYTKARWCTAADDYYYDLYTEDGEIPLYVIKYYENGICTEMWQAAYRSGNDEYGRKGIELMDKEDRRKFDFLMTDAPNEVLNKIISINGNLSLLDYREIFYKHGLYDPDQFFTEETDYCDPADIRNTVIALSTIYRNLGMIPDDKFNRLLYEFINEKDIINEMTDLLLKLEQLNSDYIDCISNSPTTIRTSLSEKIELDLGRITRLYIKYKKLGRDLYEEYIEKVKNNKKLENAPDISVYMYAVDTNPALLDAFIENSNILGTIDLDFLLSIDLRIGASRGPAALEFIKRYNNKEIPNDMTFIYWSYYRDSWEDKNKFDEYLNKCAKGLLPEISEEMIGEAEPNAIEKVYDESEGKYKDALSAVLYCTQRKIPLRLPYSKTFTLDEFNKYGPEKLKYVLELSKNNKLPECISSKIDFKEYGIDLIIEYADAINEDLISSSMSCSEYRDYGLDKLSFVYENMKKRGLDPSITLAEYLAYSSQPGFLEEYSYIHRRIDYVPELEGKYFEYVYCPKAYKSACEDGLRNEILEKAKSINK